MSANEFGDLLTQGLKSIAALEKKDLTVLQQELGHEIGTSVWTIYKWRKGASLPTDARTIRLLASACVTRGRMDYNWVTRFLKPVTHSITPDLIEELCPGAASKSSVTHNLPRRQHRKLIGRETELEDLKAFLSPRHRVGVVCISGGGGVGKTALALEIAHHYYEENANLPPDERFDAIVWVTAKNVELLPTGPVRRQPTFTDLDGVYRAIAELLDVPALFRTATQAEKNIIAMRLLGEKRVLLMFDNLEDVDDQEFMVFLRDLPAPSKAIITTRHRIDVAVPIHLHALDHTQACELVLLECERNCLHMTDEQIGQLLQRTGGLPLAIIRTIGRMAWRGSSIETELLHLSDPDNDAYDFCFGKTIALIKPGDAYDLFLILAIFAAHARRDALGFIAGFEDNVARRDEALSDLEVLSLCTRDKDRFDLEPMTRTHALAELRSAPDLEQNARERWVQWYLQFTQFYGGIDWQEWHSRYDVLEEEWSNVLAVAQWCMEARRYSDVLALWQNVRDFTHIYGYWSDRLDLLTWITTEAQNRRDWATVVEALNERGFTLTITGVPARLTEAETLLQHAWSLRDHAATAKPARTAALIGSLATRQTKYTEAHYWFDTSESLLLAAEIDETQRARELTSTLFDLGETWQIMGDYDRAEQVFQEMLAQAQTCGWQRGLLYGQNWLAHTHILQGHLALAEQLLNQGWPPALRNKEKRLIAMYRRTFAYLYQQRNDAAEAYTWAAEALDNFERLGMSSETSEMQKLLENLIVLREQANSPDSVRTYQN
ncbi:MAG TPA: NB-ARC domain-containing protein [Aggregatilinea sp.]|jgi:LuxR family glucitol operon transcriptional activator|uniref:NB-ARC domain-containing protein n=1 Tax=Aggregatilinea sp. TaxID=2806333 RepID=UPI002C3AB27F|nr:NB-ARC domain-containing protein [Aggregatilinea sp.]HML21166.1 NB-ARC domain-containing protein [Aggregatilinea sp.]